MDINHPDIKTLRWFSKDFYALAVSKTSDQIIYKDLRYPLLDQNDPNSSLFSFRLVKEGNRWNTKNLSEERFKDQNAQDFVTDMFKRAFRDF